MISLLQDEPAPNQALYTYLYLAATVLFIWGIKRLGKVKTARSGNQLAAVGMLIATVTAIAETQKVSWTLIAVGLILGTLIGAVLARRVAMTAMPELVAAFNGLGGAASMFVGLAFLAVNVRSEGNATAGMTMSQLVTVPLSILIGGATLTGSGVAYLKLSGKKIVHPFSGASRHGVHAVLAILLVLSGLWMSTLAESAPQVAMAAMVIVAISCLLGVFLVMPIGGADMPVVVALLNSYSGLAAAASGFVIGNLLLVVSGALVGASGLILTQIMCKAMNRSLGNVLLGGIGDDSVAKDARDYTGIKETSPEEVAMLLDAASSIIIVPGYGLAVAQAQHVTRELGQELEKRGKQVRYAIHPVAGRMPGHMNVLLAEADVPYDRLFELERINGDFVNTDLVLILGANDVVNPAAREDKTSPIYGMPILDVDYARTVVMVKRSLSPGYAGIKNPLFEKDNTLMVFLDAKEAIQAFVTEVKEL
ncbi:MAG: NAD(P)(+) transhydrogenase (Re/Si-specific) subunit beta [Planctomycetes bacterium]|nr:NAD(P)(+) transhydrogenase (Re/Si-specific) subunit beta [Planctomycetota bacterium]MCB9888147.1 NAD(P)(+) transhydrogenase (Re/Si-specific) subunit beta [Planctomycetota bacterium]